jgi:predicted small lipoprotein YifL
VRKPLVLLLCAALAACGERTPEAPPPDETPVHEHHAPHGGALEVLGDETAHVELLLDAETGKLTAYVLDGEAESPVRIAQTSLRLTIGGRTVVELNAVANPLTGERVGDTSQFEGASGMLRGLTKFDGVLESITARGVKFDAVPVGYPGGNEREERPDAGK